MKYIAAISDADILIHLAKANALDILPLLFEKIIIPKYVFEREIKGKAGNYLSAIEQYIGSDKLLRVEDRESDRVVNMLAKPIIEDKRVMVGRGESECAGYATAMGIPIIISDNETEFRYFEEYVMLTYYNILTLLVHWNYLDQEMGKRKYEDINGILGYPSGKTFEIRQRETLNKIRKNEWEKPLGF